MPRDTKLAVWISRRIPHHPGIKRRRHVDGDGRHTSLGNGSRAHVARRYFGHRTHTTSMGMYLCATRAGGTRTTAPSAAWWSGTSAFSVESLRQYRPCASHLRAARTRTRSPQSLGIGCGARCAMERQQLRARMVVGWAVLLHIEPRTAGWPQSGQSAPSRQRWCAPPNGSRPAEWLRGAADVEQQWPVDARAAAVEGAATALVAPLLHNHALWGLPVGY